MAVGTIHMSSILFVSHDGDLRAVARRALERAGCRVTVAAHGGHASLACAAGDAFDVLVIESEMPEGPGAAIAGRLRRYFPDLPIVRMCEAGTEAAGDGIAVVRPFTADDLMDAVVRAASEKAAAGTQAGR